MEKAYRQIGQVGVIINEKVSLMQENRRLKHENDDLRNVISGYERRYLAELCNGYRKDLKIGSLESKCKDGRLQRIIRTVCDTFNGDNDFQYAMYAIAAASTAIMVCGLAVLGVIAMIGAII